MALLTHDILNMRVVPLTEKLQAKYPKIWAKAVGKELDGSGKLVPAAVPIPFSVLGHPSFVCIEGSNGRLVMPDGRQGRSASVGLAQSVIDAKIAEARAAAAAGPLSLAELAQAAQSQEPAGDATQEPAGDATTTAQDGPGAEEASTAGEGASVAPIAQVEEPAAQADSNVIRHFEEVKAAQAEVKAARKR